MSHVTLPILLYWPHHITLSNPNTEKREGVTQGHTAKLVGVELWTSPLNSMVLLLGQVTGFPISM